MGLAGWMLLLSAIGCACGGRALVPACNEAGEYCHDHAGQEVCCPLAYPYCGVAGTDCPPGYCCSEMPRP